MKLKLTNKTHRWLHDNRSYQGEGCLIWPYSRLRGYGNVFIFRKMTYAHTVMCELVHGPKPSPEHQAAHSCGRGRFGCCNPKHLSWKTRSENQLDKRQHGGLYRGGRRKKISDDDVRALSGAAGKSGPRRSFIVSKGSMSLSAMTSLGRQPGTIAPADERKK